MGIEQVKSDKDDAVLVRKGESIVSSKGGEYDVYTEGHYDYFNMDDIKYRIVGYIGKDKVAYVGAGVAPKKEDTLEDSGDTLDRVGLLAKAELLHLEFPKNIKTPALKILVETAEKSVKGDE